MASARVARGTVTRESLERAALAYLERFDSSVSNLRRVLQRQIRRRPPEQRPDPEELARLIDELLQRYQSSGLLNDARFAEHRVRGLRARGTSARVIRQKLLLKGVAEATIDALLASSDETEQDTELAAAVRFARRRRLGPFARGSSRPLEKDLAALARAGFSFRVARAALAADPNAEQF